MKTRNALRSFVNRSVNSLALFILLTAGSLGQPGLATMKSQQ